MRLTTIINQRWSKLFLEVVQNKVVKSLNKKKCVKIRSYLPRLDHEDAAKFFIARGIDPNVGSQGNDSALIVAISKRKSFENYKKFCTRKIGMKYRCVCACVCWLLTEYDEIAELLIERGANINAVGDDGMYKIDSKWTKWANIGFYRIHSITAVSHHRKWSNRSDSHRKRSKCKYHKWWWWFGIESSGQK